MISVRPASPLVRALTGAALVLAGSGLMCLSARIAVPMVPVPVTLQTLAIPILVALLGRELGTLAVLAYLAEGFAGLPVFAVGSLATTAGYLIGFPIAAFVIGTFYHDGFSRGYFRRLIAILVGTGLVLISGTLWLALTFTHDLASAVALGLTPFLVGDLAKSVVAAAFPPRAFVRPRT
jgi:biotin transport system substrate-specific component